MASQSTKLIEGIKSGKKKPLIFKSFPQNLMVLAIFSWKILNLIKANQVDSF